MKLFALVTIVALGVGCGSSDDAAANHANQQSANSSTDGVDVYADGLMKSGDHFHVVLMSATPAPPDVGDNTWTLRILDHDQHAIDGAKVTLSPFMPSHGHGTTPADFTGVFSEDGTYEIGPFELFMPGLWETTVKVEDEMIDEVTFTFELEG